MRIIIIGDGLISSGLRAVTPSGRCRAAGLALGVALAAACSSPTPPSDAATDARDAATDARDAAIAPDAPAMDAPAGPRPSLVVQTDTDRDSRFVTMEHMIASFEMQQSGEPLAQAMGRSLAGFDRFAISPDFYTDPTRDGGAPERDLAGFASAVESYEYSKMAMNSLVVESSAGTSLAHAALVNGAGATGLAAMTLLRDRVQRYSLASHAGVRGAPGATPTGFVTVPAPSDNPLNVLGFGGIWPAVHPFRSFDPTITPSRGATRGCSLSGGYGASAGAAQVVGDYECGYSTLHLSTSRGDGLAIERVVSPGASSWAAWKYALWAVNYLQIMHDAAGHAIDAVPEAELARVGREGNTVQGTAQGGGAATPGTWLGSTDLEGMQASFMLEAIDAQAHDWIRTLSTVDGATLSGFASVRDALAYDYQSPLRWLPAEVRYDEESDAVYGFHRPVRYRVGRSDSRLLDLAGALGAFSEAFALTDRRNRDVGGAQAARAYFDGEPFAADNLDPDGEDTTHDRALAVIKLSMVDLDRAHRDPATGYLADAVTFTGATPSRGDVASTVNAAYALVALRVARRSLAGALTLYSNSTPDTAVVRTALDGTSMRGAPDGGTVAQRLTAMIRSEAELLYTRLTDEQGRALPGLTLSTRAPTAAEGDLESYAAAVRGLLEASLATGDTRYRVRAERVFHRMESVFYSATVRAWRATADAAPDAPITFTPLRFALLQSALREVYRLLASAPGREVFARTVEGYVARLDKLVLNGWDDRDDDDEVDWPAECAFVVGSSPRGGLQMAERALTGETGFRDGQIVDDRDRDCVPEIGAANLPATLAAQIRFTVRRP